MTAGITEEDLLHDIGMDDARIASLEHNLTNAIAERCKRMVELAEVRYGVKIGRFVISKGKEYKIIAIEPSAFGKPHLKGVPRKTDGTWSIDPRHLYGWELVPETQSKI